jgi:hypothetical protein
MRVTFILPAICRLLGDVHKKKFPGIKHMDMFEQAGVVTD